MSQTYRISLYQSIFESAKKHFWFMARNALLAKTITSFIPRPKGKTFLEVGCGGGIVLQLLTRLGFVTTGLDVNQEAINYAKKEVNISFIRKSFYVFNTNKRYDSIGMFDVLEHQRDDLLFLKQSYRFLKDDGWLFLTVPAGQNLWNAIDKASGHQRRYDLPKLKQKITKAGFTIVYANYWQIITLPFFIISRYFHSKDIDEYLKAPVEPVNTFLFWLLLFEQKFVFWLRFPYGTSIIVAAQKKIKK
jgi:2-polyprenyl-3-methyl-5-hydroxy-6-metoxy-1,4-benzoquinol methylase